MIQANELRIGNYLFDEEYVQIVKVVEMAEMMITVFFPDDYVGYRKLDEISGIPLTQEWLVESDMSTADSPFHSEYYIGWLGIDLVDGKYQLSWAGAFVKNIEYVHDLQNAVFAFLQKELTFDK